VSKDVRSIVQSAKWFDEEFLWWLCVRRAAEARVVAEVGALIEMMIRTDEGEGAPRAYVYAQ
jgi:hypothetical protein